MTTPTHLPGSIWAGMRRAAQIAFTLLPIALAAQVTNGPVLGIHSPRQYGWPRIDTVGPTNTVYHLQASSNFVDWNNIATTLDGLHAYPDPAAPGFPFRIYRTMISPKTEENDWKNQILFPADPFLSPQFGISINEIRWIKFAILLSDPFRVYYQDSRKYLFHYDYAVERLSPFLGMTPNQFDQVSLHRQGQQVILGTVLYAPPPNTAEFGIQLVGLDPYPPEEVRNIFDLVRATVAAQEGVQALYMPAFEQIATTQTNLDYLATHGIQVSSTDRWLPGDQCYASGWALGRLKYFPGTEIDLAYQDGRLEPGDILLTDIVPSEIPFLAGVMSLTPSTPNSHVAILSRSFGIPFVHLADPENQARAQQWIGRRIALRVNPLFESCEVTIIDLEDELSPALETEILDLKRPPELSITPTESLGAFSASVDELRPSDIRYFGGKAANFGFLRREIPSHAPAAIAFSFDLWDAFMDQVVPESITLRASISNRLSGYVYPPDMASLKTDLQEIRDMIVQTAEFAPELRQAITNALLIFDPFRKIRFRSSTNFEDTEQAVGAGLFDSYSGCLLDDLDGDNLGPSHCDPTKEEERGVFRAIRKVYASFYNDNAYLERLRLGVRESEVGMAVLVHHSFPDEIELANGVAALDFTASVDPIRFNGDMVTQEGAVPVTNPDGTASPEVVSVSRYSFGTYFHLKQRSSLVPLGAYVLDWQNEYEGYADLFARVAEGYAREFPAKQRFLLDFEYKKVVPSDLVVKQVRELPLPDTQTTVIPFLLNQSNRFCVFQGEYGDVFSNHRLKSRWTFQTANLRLSETNLVDSFFEDATWEYLDGTQPSMLSGPPSSWDNARHSVEGEKVLDGWRMGAGQDRRDFELEITIRREVQASQSPLFVLADFPVYLHVRYATPLPTLDYMGQPNLATNEAVDLVPCPAVTPTSLYQTRSATNNGVVIQTKFYWPEEPTGVVAGYTAPLIAWDQTIITGLTAESIVLQGYYSQTYRPGHHNFSEEYLFEPRLEPGLSPAILSELESQNIQLVHLQLGFVEPRMTILGLDGKFRPLSGKDPVVR